MAACLSRLKCVADAITMMDYFSTNAVVSIFKNVGVKIYQQH